MEDYGDIPRLYNPTLRLVDLNLLAKILWCQQCCLPLSLRKAVLDKYNMYKSELHIKCLGCSEVKVVPLTLLGPGGNCGAYKRVLCIQYAKQDLKEMADKCLEANKQHCLDDTKLEPLDLDDLSEDYSDLNKETNLEEVNESEETEEEDEEENSSESASEPDCSEYEPFDGDLDSSDIEPKSRKPNKCFYCQEEFHSRTAATSHMTKDHPDYLKLKCGHCKKKFATKLRFNFHMRYNHNPAKARICPQCGKMCANPYALNSHMKSHISEKDASTPCPVCHRLFKSKEHLNRHKHTHDPPVVCHFCDKKYSKKQYLAGHMYLHVSNKTYDCDYCGAQFVRNANRKIHMKNNHNFVCLVCYGKFNLMEDVRNHCEKEHSQEEIEASKLNGVPFEKVTLFQCNHCFQYLSSKRSLDVHLNTHTGEGTSRSRGSTKKKKKTVDELNKVDATTANMRGKKRSQTRGSSTRITRSVTFPA